MLRGWRWLIVIIALIGLAAFWAVLVLVLCVVLIGTYNVLTSTKLTIDAMRDDPHWMAGEERRLAKIAPLEQQSS